MAIQAKVSDVSVLSVSSMLVASIFRLKRSMLQAAFFLDPNQDCVVECLESCCSESSPARYDKTLRPFSIFLCGCSPTCRGFFCTLVFMGITYTPEFSSGLIFL